MTPKPKSEPVQSEKVGLLKYAWRNLGIRQLVLERRFRALELEWKAARSKIKPAQGDPANILIIPSDPELLTSSTGDQAMIGAIMAHWRVAMPGARFHVAVANDRAGAAAREYGMAPLHLLTPGATFADACQRAEACHIGTVIAMGADVLDGSYNVAFSGRQLMLLDLLAHRGANAFITGFSVSQDFHPKISRLFDALDPSVLVNLRDPVSLERFERACARPAKLVADVAFLLEPRTTPATEDVLLWAAQRREAGHVVLGLNCHPLLLELEERHELDRFLARFIEMIAAFAGNRAVAFVLIDHDRRGSSADAICLRPVHRGLAERLGDERLYYPEARLAADEIKAVVRGLDGVISGRMHLMIAAMGVGTPVFGIDYKDKMEGLLNHFGLPTDALCAAPEFMKHDVDLPGRLAAFVDRIDSIRAQVAHAKPKVRAAAELNFAKTA